MYFGSKGIFRIIFFVIISYFGIVFTEDVQQLKLGNFALPSSQQPGPLVGFGQNMLDKGDLQLFNFIDYLHGCNKNFSQIIPTLLYGFTTDLSLYLQLPIATKFQENNDLYRGPSEALMQLEYSFFNRSTETTLNQISVVANVAFSFESGFKSIRKGQATTNLFLGFTASHMGTDWYPFASLGVIYAVPESKKTKYGNQVLYECGLSRNISYKEDGYIFNWMIELDGFYEQQDKECGACNPNSGSNTILFGPSLWFSTKHFSIQGGISGVIYEKLQGKQNRNKYYITVDIGWKF